MAKHIRGEMQKKGSYRQEPVRGRGHKLLVVSCTCYLGQVNIHPFPPIPRTSTRSTHREAGDGSRDRLRSVARGSPALCQRAAQPAPPWPRARTQRRTRRTCRGSAGQPPRHASRPAPCSQRSTATGAESASGPRTVCVWGRGCSIASWGCGVRKGQGGCIFEVLDHERQTHVGTSEEGQQAQGQGKQRARGKQDPTHDKHGQDNQDPTQP